MTNMLKSAKITSPIKPDINSELVTDYWLDKSIINNYYLLDNGKNCYNLLEKYISEISNFHCNRL